MGLLNSLSELRKWGVLLVVALALFLGYKYLTSEENTTTIESDTNLIQQQIKNVGKLVVTEGHFAEVLTYKDQKKKAYLPGVTFDKKALVVINADVTVAFDLSKLTYDINEKEKILTLTNIPKEEIKINPDIKYYDMESSVFNEFTGEDYNKISKLAKENMAKKIENSSLKSNAKNRLLSELTKLFILTNSMGWKLQYKGNFIKEESEIKL